MATKRPKHDPATAWKKPGVDTTGLTAPLTTDAIFQAYARIMAGAPGVGTSYSQSAPGYAQQQLSAAIPANWAQQLQNQMNQAYYYGPSASRSPKIRWADVQVGDTVAVDAVTLPEVVSSHAMEGNFDTLYEFADGSRGGYDSALNIIIKSKAAAPPSPVAAPEDIEETTEVLTGWRVFSVRDYKLRGTWSTWEGRVFHASCNCEEFRDRNNYNAAPVTEFQLREERREDLRKHLAAGAGTCGVYSRKRLSLDKHYNMEIYGGGAVSVVARCVNYGLGYEYDSGYRSEYSRIEHLWLLAKGPVYDPTNGGGQYPLCHADEGQSNAISPDTLAQVLSTTYGVSCDVMTPLEFAYKEEAGLL